MWFDTVLRENKFFVVEIFSLVFLSLSLATGESFRIFRSRETGVKGNDKNFSPSAQHWIEYFNWMDLFATKTSNIRVWNWIQGDTGGRNVVRFHQITNDGQRKLLFFYVALQNSGGNDVTLWAFFRGIRISICIQYASLVGFFFFCQITFDGGLTLKEWKLTVIKGRVQ